MAYPIKKDYISDLPHNAYRHGIGKPEGVVLHETGAWGGTAETNRNFEANHWNNAFVHFFVDWNSIVQVADTNYLAWGAGHTANQRYIHIELVRTKDKAQFEASYKRYVWLVAKMLRDYGLKPKRLDTLWTHHDVTKNLGGTTHTDPDDYLKYHGYTVDQLIGDIITEYNGGGSQKMGKAIGTLEVICAGLNVHNAASFSAPVVKVAHNGDKFDVYAESNGLYQIAAGEFVSAGDKYVKFAAAPKEAPKPEPKVEATKPATVVSNYPKAQKFVMDKGISDGSSPTEPPTREQLWVMLQRTYEATLKDAKCSCCK